MPQKEAAPAHEVQLPAGAGFLSAAFFARTKKAAVYEKTSKLIEKIEMKTKETKSTNRITV